MQCMLSPWASSSKSCLVPAIRPYRKQHDFMLSIVLWVSEGHTAHHGLKGSLRQEGHRPTYALATTGAFILPRRGRPTPNATEAVLPWHCLSKFPA